MPIDSEFWINAWNEGRTAFHQKDFHEKLIEYFPQLGPKEGQRVLVPLCGKTKDLLWLEQLKLNVHGVELYDKAVEAFFSENQISPVKKTQDQDFTHYAYNHIVISAGDFFKTKTNTPYDFVYDRAALVALPSELRKTYAQTVKKLLKTGGKYLLIAYEYDQSKMDGPPFSVDAKEIHALYADQFSIRQMESKAPNKEGARLEAVQTLRQTVYILEKIG